jgi:tripartite ATP-independent transporter DctP family solute receptor
MSSSPADQDWFDETLPLPQAGLIWPWITAGALLFGLGIWLLLPVDSDKPLRPRASPLATPIVTPLPTQAVDPAALNCVFVDSSNSSFAEAAGHLDQILRTRSQAQLGLQLHSSGQFDGKKLDEMSIIEQVRSGRAQLGVVTCSPLTNFSPDFEIFDLPFLIQSYEQADQVLSGPVGEQLLSSLEPQGLVGLGTLEVGFRIFSSSVPLPALSDFRGKRVRVMQSSTAIQMARQLGCEAVPAPVDRIYQMGKEGYIDAADRTYPTYWDFRLYEVHRYITESRHSYTMKVIIMNKAAYTQLSPEQRSLLRQSVQEVEGEQRQRQREEDQRVKLECRRRGIQIFELDEQEINEFVETCQPLYEEYFKLRGPDLVEAIRKTRPERPTKPTSPGDTPSHT